MTEPIIWRGTILAYVISGTAVQEKTLFPTPPDLELQVGFVVYPAGGVIASHRHAAIRRTIDRTCEVIVVKKGRCEVDVYTDDRELVATRQLGAGDVLILVSGGHGFRMQEDTVLLEVKQGPYPGPSEKELLG